MILHKMLMAIQCWNLFFNATAEIYLNKKNILRCKYNICLMFKMKCLNKWMQIMKTVKIVECEFGSIKKKKNHLVLRK